MTRALITTDGSDLAVDAAHRAQGVLAPITEVIVLCVQTDVPGDDAGGFEGPIETPDEIKRGWAQLQSDAEAAIERTVAVLPSTASIVRRVEVGDAGATICGIAENEEVDVIVVGSHGRGLLGRIVHLGSVSEHVMRHAPCPVLVVRATQA